MKGKEKEKADWMEKGGSRKEGGGGAGLVGIKKKKKNRKRKKKKRKKKKGNLQLILKLGSVDRPKLSEMFVPFK